VTARLLVVSLVGCKGAVDAGEDEAQYSIPTFNKGIRREVRETGAADPTTPLAEKEAGFARLRLSRAVGTTAARTGYAPDVEAVTDYTDQMRHLAGFVEQAFGRGVIFYRSSDQRALDGFYVRQQPDVIFVNTETDDGSDQIIGHELVPSLAHANLAAYRALATAIEKLLRHNQHYDDQLAESYRALGRTPPT